MLNFEPMLQKQTILKITNVYTANAFQSERGILIGAGSETEPDARLYDLASNKAERVDDCPGGMMSFVPIPGLSGSYVTIQGLFPPFIGNEAGLYLHEKTELGWKSVKALDLPFVHRCEFISHAGRVFLVAATVSSFKGNPADWSRPGELHLISLGSKPALPWQSRVIDSGITRNHGMVRATVEGEECICISGAEGIFKITPGKWDHWDLITILEKEVSEMTFLDLDGNGQQELVTIEPFHGNTLNIYKKHQADWKLIFSDSLSFGHGLSSGIFNGTPVIVVGTRSDSLNLEIITSNNLLKGLVNRKVIEENVGPTQTQVFSSGTVDYILSVNQRKDEVALYTGTLD